MQREELVIGSSRSIEIPPILAVMRYSSSEWTRRIAIGGDVYELPDEFVHTIEGWDDLIWIRKISRREAGTIIYKTANDVNLFLSDGKQWPLARLP